MKEDVALARQVSRYATENYGEFYAEWRSGVLAGKKYSPEVDALAKKVQTSGGAPRR